MNQPRRKTWIAILLLFVIAITGFSFWSWPLEFFGVFSQLRMILIGAHSEFTTVNGYHVHYYVLGPANGQPVVLVHGLGGRAEDWVKLAPYLAKAEYRVYLPDLPGYGQSERPANFSYSVSDEASVVLGFCDVLGLKKVDLGGWSMGGWIVQLIAGEHPEMVRRLMLFDAGGLDVKPDWNTMAASTCLNSANRRSSSWWMLIVPMMGRTAPAPAPHCSAARAAASLSLGWLARPR